MTRKKMPKFIVRGEYIQSWDVEVEAENAREARDIAWETWKDSGDIMDTDTNIFDVEKLKE